MKNYNFAVINARSLAPKIVSLSENFHERNWTMAFITETWFSDGPVFDHTKAELLHDHGIDLICTNRSGKTNGGTAIAFRKSMISLQNYPTRKNGCEVAVAKGKFHNNTRVVFVICGYLPPGMSKRSSDKYISTIRDILNKIKTECRRPLIMLGGDFNQYDIGPALEDFFDIGCCDSPPTCDGERLDLLFTNEPRAFSCSITSPLDCDNSQGHPSDHEILLCALSISHVHEFEWIRCKTRLLTEKNKELFRKEYCDIDWQKELSHTDCPSQMVDTMHRITTDMLDRCLPWISRKIRSTDGP